MPWFKDRFSQALGNTPWIIERECHGLTVRKVLIACSYWFPLRQPDGSDVGGLEKVVPLSADENFSRVLDELVAGGR